jgi:hypothetical protein
MALRPRGKSIPGITFGVLTIFSALGNFDVGLYPYGTAVWVRPLFSLMGIVGAIMLFAGIGWWRVLLPLWCLLQTWVIATDVSGRWFAQGLFAGYTHSESNRTNNFLTSFQESGVNFAGLILFAILSFIIASKLHPDIRRAITARQRNVVGALTAIFLFIATTLVICHRVQAASANFVIDVDVPGTPIYYQGQMLGRTPLTISPEKIQQWGLPLSPAGKLEMYSWGWGDAVMLTDGTTHLPLFAGPPWPFAADLDTFESPWGTRCRISAGDDDGERGYLFPRAQFRDEPILIISPTQSGAVAAGSSFKLDCVLTNPSSRDYRGVRSSIERKCFSYIRRDPNPSPIPKAFRWHIDLPSTWNDLPAGARHEEIVEFDAPHKPDDYELFCTWDLFSEPNSDRLDSGSIYSNMLTLKVIGPAATQP